MLIVRRKTVFFECHHHFPLIPEQTPGDLDLEHQMSHVNELYWFACEPFRLFSWGGLPSQ